MASTVMVVVGTRDVGECLRDEVAWCGELGQVEFRCINAVLINVFG